MAEMPPLSRRERQVMDIIHELGGATAVQIRERMSDPPTDSAVRSVLRILVRKGHLAKEYRPPLRLLAAHSGPRGAAQRDEARPQDLLWWFGGSSRGYADHTGGGPARRRRA